ncbi:MAG TPA: GNAT family protein [Bacteroidia bacterium]|nr:GNAT family protein [Bacteroidia bacterium]
MQLSVREIEKSDIDSLVKYWLESDEAHHAGMGVDPAKIPDEKAWRLMLSKQLNQAYKEKQSYCIIWEVDGKAMGHCNINPVVFGEEAFIHLHLWKSDIRKKGIGTELVKMTLPYFFNNMQLKKIYCEPYALNPAPNRTLPKLGFEFVKEYVTVPGSLNFEQPVRRWELSLEKFEEMNLI